MLELLKELEEAEKVANEKDKIYDENPESEIAERAFDEAYKKEIELLNAAANKLVEITENKIDFKTARLMIQSKREEIKEILK